MICLGDVLIVGILVSETELCSVFMGPCQGI